MPGHPPNTDRTSLPIAAPARMLVRGVNWLGDAVMTTPALQRIRERFPSAQITLLAPEKLAGLWLHHPSLDRVLTFAPGEQVWSVARRLRAENFDLALVLPNSPRSALEAWLAGIPQRLGYARRWRSWFLTHPIPARPGHVRMRKLSPREISRLINLPAAHTRHAASHTPAASHQIHEYLNLAAALGANPEPLAPSLAVTPQEVATIVAKFDLGALSPSGPILGLNPGAEYGPAKRWPAERFIAAAREIQERTNCAWLIFGGRSDIATANAIQAALHSTLRAPHTALLNLAGQTSLRELMGLLKICRVVLTNDTGPMHLAAALGTAVVAPFGSTSPELSGPGLPGDSSHCLLRSSAPCSPCFRRACPIDFRCMTDITVERVVEAVVSSATRSPTRPVS